MKFLIMGLLLGLLFGLFGIPMHNYEVHKCQHSMVHENQFYEAGSDCYLPIVKPEWNLFWNIFTLALLGILLFGTIGLMVDSW